MAAMLGCHAEAYAFQALLRLLADCKMPSSRQCWICSARSAWAEKGLLQPITRPSEPLLVTGSRGHVHILSEHCKLDGLMMARGPSIETRHASFTSRAPFGPSIDLHSRLLVSGKRKVFSSSSLIVRSCSRVRSF